MPRGAVKKHPYRERVLMRSYREAGITLEVICECWPNELSIATLCRYLAELRKTMGPEKLPNRHRARWPAMMKRQAQLSEKGSEGQQS